MVDYTFGVLRPHWVSTTGVETLTSNMEFITISTMVDIRMASQTGGSHDSQMNLNKLLEIVSLRGQPVIMGAVTGTGPFVLLVASEHAGGWQNVAHPNDLASRLLADGVNFGFGFDATGAVPPGVDDSGMTVTFTNVMT